MIATPKTFSDEKDRNLNLEKCPFSEIIDWREEEQRQKYDTILAEKYKIEKYTVLYQSERGIIKDPWYSNEEFKIISNRDGSINGYILSFENLTIPALFYKQNRDDDNPKPKLVYAHTSCFEIISDINERIIKINSFNVVSLPWYQKPAGWGGIIYVLKEKRGIFKGRPQSGYNYCQSMNEMLDFLTKHFETLIKESRSPTNNNQIIINASERLKRYEDIKSQIKAEIKQYGGNNWGKIMQDIQKKWPAFSR